MPSAIRIAAGCAAIASAVLSCQVDRTGGSVPLPEISPSDPPPGSILIEAEDFDESVAPEAGVPRPHDLPWASGRSALVRFHRADRVGWRFEMGTEGPQEVWLRYAATRGMPLRWAVDSAEWGEVRVPSTGALEGRGAWAWARLGTVDARPGERTISLAGAGLRPDCFLVAPAGRGEPRWPPEPSASAPSSEVLERLASVAPRAQADWIPASRAIELPRWIEDTRVGLHTRLSVAWTDEPIFTRAEAAAASLGAPAIVRHVKAMKGQCYWKTAQGAVAPWVEDATVGGVDPVAAMARRAHAEGLAFVAYYRHQEDRPLAREHPDWVCRDLLDRTVRRGREPRLCFHSPFADLTLERLLELAERGADAVYLDESHQPLDGCWCPWTREAFERETGLPLPTSRSPEDPLYRRFLGFTEDSLARELWRWRAELRARHPDFALLVSTHTQPDPLSVRPSLRLASVADVVKTEFDSGLRPSLRRLLEGLPELQRPSGDALLSLGWATSRDGAFGRPAHVWVHGLEGAPRWRAAAAAVVASGCVANLDHPEATLPDAESLASAFRFARELSIPLAGARPLPDVLLHLPERGLGSVELSPAEAWKIRGPLVAAWEALGASHAPRRIVSDDQLAAGVPGGTRILFLPAPDLLDEPQRRAVARFTERGGEVIAFDSAEIAAAARALPLPVSVETSAPVTTHWFRAPDGALLVGITNTFAWTAGLRAKPPPPVDDLRLGLEATARTVRVWPSGERLTIVDGPRGREANAPGFREALVLRIEE